MTLLHDSVRRLLEESTKRKRQCLDRLEREKRQLELIDAEIASYNKVLAAVGVVPVETAPIASEKKRPAHKAPRKRGLIQKWKAIFRTAYETCTPPYSYDDLSLAAVLAGHEVASPALRTQMMNSVNSGLFERVGAGQFRITNAGLDAIGITNNEGSAVAEPSNVGSVAERSIAPDSKSGGPANFPGEPGPEGSNPSTSAPTSDEDDNDLI